MYVIGRPVIQFTTSSLSLFLLSDVPKFEENSDKVFAAQEKTDKKIKEKKVETDANDEIASSKIDYPQGGQQYGKVVVKMLKLDVPLYYGDTDEILRVGSGQYMGSLFPGELGTTLIGGHNIDGFGKLIALKAGDTFEIHTTYGDYTYNVAEVAVKNKNDKQIDQLIDQRKSSKAILYTCYPVDSMGMTDERVFVTADLVSGPIINENK